MLYLLLLALALTSSVNSFEILHGPRQFFRQPEKYQHMRRRYDIGDYLFLQRNSNTYDTQLENEPVTKNKNRNLRVKNEPATNDLV